MELNHRHTDFQSAALPTELLLQILVPPSGIEPEPKDLQSFVLYQFTPKRPIFFARVLGFEPKLTESKSVVLTITLYPSKENYI